MKKILAVLLILIVVAAGILIMVNSRAQPLPARLMEMSFHAYTNTPAGPSALLAIHYEPAFGGCRWSDFETSRRVNGQWQTWSTPGRAAAQNMISFPPPFPRRRDGQTINGLMDMPVENTNDLWRFVMKIHQNPPRPPFLARFGHGLKAILTRTQPPPLRGEGDPRFTPSRMTPVSAK